MAIWSQPRVQFLTLRGCDAPPEVAVLQESVVASEQLGLGLYGPSFSFLWV